MKTMYKMVDFSYPTSTNAKKFGFYQTGCYTVQLLDNSKPPKHLKGFATAKEAVAYAETLPETWHPMYLKCLKHHIDKAITETV